MARSRLLPLALAMQCGTCWHVCKVGFNVFFPSSESERVMSSSSHPVSYDHHSKPLNFQKWLDDNQARLQPPVGNQQIWKNADLICTVVGGPN